MKHDVNQILQEEQIHSIESSDCWTLDIGNARYKWGVFRKGQLINHGSDNSASKIASHLKAHGVKKLWTSQVCPPREKALRPLLSPFCHMHVFRYPIPNLPIKINYRTPDTLGMDRIAQALAAYRMAAGSHLLIFSLGTCMVHSFLNQKGILIGGGISPGLNLRIKSLKNLPSLPQLSPKPFEELSGQDTQESLQVGIVNGLWHEIEGICHAYQCKYPDLKVFCTGGEASFFENKWKSSTLLCPHLVLYGLYELRLLCT
ncbi:MAG: type III pantothenate kinase [Cytophagales bacterium]|nr:type III pantothenate kinase [Cytophagales bacterium]